MIGGAQSPAQCRPIYTILNYSGAGLGWEADSITTIATPAVEADVEAVGLAWYGRRHYHHIRAIMIDNHDFAPSYEAWLEHALKIEAEHHGAQRLVYRIQIDPEPFAIWCADNDLSPDAQARTLYVSQAVGRRHDPGKL